MNTHAITVPVDQTTGTLLTDALRRSGCALIHEVQLRLQDHIKLIEHVSPAGARYFRGGCGTEVCTRHLPVSECASPAFFLELTVDGLTGALLQSAGWAEGRAMDREAALRLKDSLCLFEWVGESGERQWKVSPAATKNRLPLAGASLPEAVAIPLPV